MSIFCRSHYGQKILLNWCAYKSAKYTLLQEGDFNDKPLRPRYPSSAPPCAFCTCNSAVLRRKGPRC